MSDYLIRILSHFSVCIPFFTNIFLFRKIDIKYRPFCYFIFLVAIADLSSVFSILFFPRSQVWTPILNINILGESLLLTWMYHRWGLFSKNIFYKSVLSFFITGWFVETIYLGNFYKANASFSDLYDFVGLLLTIGMVNTLTKLSKDLMYYNPVFAVCIGFIVYHLFDFISDIFLRFVFNTSSSFKWRMLTIQNVSVTIMYLIFTIGLILMANKSIRGKYRKGRVRVVLDKHNYILVEKKWNS